MVAALSAPVLRPALFVSMQFATDIVNVWTGNYPITWNGLTFSGVGDLGSISAISEGSTVEAQNVTISLSGIPSYLMSELLTEVRVLGTVNVWLALFDASGKLIPTPFNSYLGKMDQPEINDGGETCTCSITVENVLVDLNRPCYRRYTNDDQQLDLSATLTRLGLAANTVDSGFQWVPGMISRVSFWGTAPGNSNNV